MATLRLEEKPFELEGKTYILRCNMAVMDELQAAHDDDFGAVLRLPERQGAAEILAAMLNHYASKRNWPERWTAEDIKERFAYSYLVEQDILGMFTRALVPGGAPDEDPAPGDDAGN